MSTTSAQILPDDYAWDVLIDPLSVVEIQHLGWLRLKIQAACWQDEHDEPIDFAAAKRLAFTKWLATTGRLNEEGRS